MVAMSIENCEHKVKTFIYPITAKQVLKPTSGYAATDDHTHIHLPALGTEWNPRTKQIRQVQWCTKVL